MREDWDLWLFLVREPRSDRDSMSDPLILALIERARRKNAHKPVGAAKPATVAVLVLAVAGSLAAKQIVPRFAGTLPTSGGLFIIFLAGVICIVGRLTFLPALSLGPIAEQVAMQAGRLY
jgi:hypothetical protein